jgi:GT2 family glycosyltransferase
MNISIITVTWNSAKLIGEQIESVKTGCRNISFEQLVVDNGSTDDTVKIVKEKYPWVKLIHNQQNIGFGAANNMAAKMSNGEFLLFLNPDMRVSPESLDTMVEWMRSHHNVGLASCRLVDENGILNADAQPRRFPGLFDQLAIILKLPHLFPSILDHYMFKGFDADKEQEVDSVRGSFMIMRREVFEKLGWAFDPRYFIWFEDVDTCREVQRLGYKVVHTPIISCIDYIGQSFKQRTTLWKQKNFTKSMLQYFQKWEPWYKWIWIAIFRPIGIATAWVNDTINKITR